MDDPQHCFALCLVVNHACNLRCSYCYAGAKFQAPMPLETGMTAIRRGLHTLRPGGQLDLGFFGGEPLLECSHVAEWMRYARGVALGSDKSVRFNLTTNGTITHPDAWRLLMTEDLELAVSFDGSPEIHDRHRRDAHGHCTARQVEATVRRLIQSCKAFHVVAVVRPDSLSEMPDGLRYLHALGVRSVTLSLDLWASWTAGDGVRLQAFVNSAADLWRSWLPDFSLNWFDMKAGQLAHLPFSEENTRCSFGSGEIAVAPSGRLYPCERLVGEDHPEHPLRLPGNALEGNDFLNHAPTPFAPSASCSRCALAPACDTTCRCSNFVRTGDVNRPDGLLCILNKSTADAVTRILGSTTEIPSSQSTEPHDQRPCYVG